MQFQSATLQIQRYTERSWKCDHLRSELQSVSSTWLKRPRTCRCQLERKQPFRSSNFLFEATPIASERSSVRKLCLAQPWPTMPLPLPQRTMHWSTACTRIYWSPISRPPEKWDVPLITSPFGDRNSQAWLCDKTDCLRHHRWVTVTNFVLRCSSSVNSWMWSAKNSSFSSLKTWACCSTLILSSRRSTVSSPLLCVLSANGGEESGSVENVTGEALRVDAELATPSTSDTSVDGAWTEKEQE